jgi:hypothetical protein
MTRVRYLGLALGVVSKRARHWVGLRPTVQIKKVTK